ncbi:hypothetical protein N7504_009547 [Penicillium tannophilum]|nr:hypothetical protein N7504_009547 [Penicillium tannophilum]
MFFKSLDLTTALRPLLLPDETLLFVQDAVGLYEGKYKIPDYQDGHAYLTSHRVCYVATDDPRKYSVAIDLKEIDRAEYQSCGTPTIDALSKLRQAGFYSSTIDCPAKSPSTPVSSTWICPICSFSNPVPSNFDPATAKPTTHLPPCLACGIKPPFTTVLKAAVSAASNREPLPRPSSVPIGDNTSHGTDYQSVPVASDSISCPRCTFVNHPSLIECEMCGAPLVATASLNRTRGHRTDSPAPFFEQSRNPNTDVIESIKLSFRGGGDKTFHERLKNALIQRKWLLQNAPPVPPPEQSTSSASTTTTSFNMLESPQPAPPRVSAVGIAGLEQRGLEARMNNQLVIGNAFEDLEALMASAKQIVALAETLARESGMSTNEGTAETTAVLSESAAALGMVTTKDMLSSGSENLYLSELARNLAEYLTDDRKGILQREGGIMSLIDLWSVFNRSRNGVELISPSDFQRAAELWEKLRLPVRLRRFKSGLLVVQQYDWSDEKTLRQLQDWMEELRRVPPEESVPWDWTVFGRAITAQETAQRFKWSVGVAAEELEMAEDRGALCREEGVEGLRFWINGLIDTPS